MSTTQPPPDAAGQHQPEHPGWWLSAITLLAALVGVCFYPWGSP